MTSIDIALEATPLVVALERIVARDEQIARLSALRAEEVHQAWQLLQARAPQDRSTGGPVWSGQRVAEVEFFTEIAALTTRTEYRARTLINTSITLLSSLPATFAAFSAGSFSEEHANVIAANADGLAGEALGRYDCRMARLAPDLTYKQLEYRARTEAEISQPATAVERVQRALKTRRVEVDPAKDGMAYLTVFAPAPEVFAIANRAVDLAKGLRDAGDPRSISQLRVDVLTELMLNGETSIPGATKGIRGRVHVTVPAMTLLGVSDEAAILRGYGPIDPVTAARLTADATSWRRVLTDPITGRILRLSPTDYRPTAEMRDHAQLVHPFCVFPGCADDSTHADIDHTADFGDGGLTDDENLAPLMPTHHRVKHHTAWMVEQNEDADGNSTGTLTWRSPAGYVYEHQPRGMMQPAPAILFAKLTEPEGPCPF